MRNKFTLLILTLVISLAYTNLLTQEQNEISNQNNENNFFEISKKLNEFYDANPEIKNGRKQFRRWENFWKKRFKPDNEIPNLTEIYNYIEKFSKSNNDISLAVSSNWKELGPVKVPTNKLNYLSSGLGRLNCFAIHPNNSNEIWVGSSGGGAWKSVDGGKNWIVADFTNFMSVGVSDIVYAPSNPDIMYIATGDANGSSMSSSYSIGILKSTDAGNTWKITNLSRQLNENVLAAKILVDPGNADLLYTATNKGIFKSTDGGNSWNLKIQNAFFQDLLFSANDSKILFAATSSSSGYVRIYKSTDSGENWVQKHLFPLGNRIKLATTKADANYLYAIVSRKYEYGFQEYASGMEGLYRSTNAGENWTKIISEPNLLARDVEGAEKDGQGHYDLALAVAPYNKDIVWTGGIHIWRTLNGGKNWQIMNHWTGSYDLPYVHADIHFLGFDEKTLDFYAATDGGLFKTTNQGNTWTDLSNGLSIMQFYKISLSQQRNGHYVCGSQDNGTNRKVSNNWTHIYGGDGMATAIDPKNDYTFYVSTYYGTFYRTTNSGASFAPIIWQAMAGEYASWVTPIAIDHENPATIYVGYQNIIRSTNSGTNWQRISEFQNQYIETFNEIVLAPSNSKIIYASTDSYLYRKIDNQAWEKVYTSSATITDIAVDNKNPLRFWITTSGYGGSNKVLEFNDISYTDLTKSLPRIPVNTIVHKKDSDTDLFVGTDAGVYFYDETINDWVLFNKNLPLLVISDLHIEYTSGKLIAATFGRGLWETEIINCNLPKPTIKIAGKTEFCEGDTLKLSVVGSYYNYEWSTGAKTPEISITESGSYYLIVYDEKGCSENSDIVEVTVTSIQDVKIFGASSNFICEGDSLNLQAFPEFASYLWSNGETTRYISVSEAGNYWVKVTSEEGCEKISDTISFEVIPNPDKPEITSVPSGLKASEAYAYQWYLNGEKLNGATTQYYSNYEMLKGKFQVEVFNENDCSAMSDDFYYDFSSVESDLGNRIFNISPNPVSYSFDLIYNNLFETKISIKIQDISGINLMERVLLINNDSGNISFDISNFPDGVYFVNISFGNSSETLKLIKNE